MTALQQQLSQAFPNLPLQNDFPLSPQTYFKVGGPAEVYVELAERGQIIALAKYCQENKIQLTPLGGASNAIVADQGITGVVIKLTNDQFAVAGNKDELTLVQVGAGMKTALLVRQTVNAGLTGLEFFLGVPGNVGGAVYNNAHYLEDLISEHVSRVEVIQADGKPLWLDWQDCEFGYDTSRFQKTKEIILQVEFELPKGTEKLSQELIRRATLYRAQTQPLGMPSSGCIFQNTPNTPELKKLFPQFADKKFVPGGFLIDQAGLKGEREGEIEVSSKHAAFFVNKGQGKAADIKKLIDRVKSVVREKFGAELKEEVFWLGKS
jgi:UDP-N-acetylmuramate dehydrogenase